MLSYQNFSIKKKQKQANKQNLAVEILNGGLDNLTNVSSETRISVSRHLDKKQNFAQIAVISNTASRQFCKFVKDVELL